MRRRQIYQMQREAAVFVESEHSGPIETLESVVQTITDPHACRKCGRTIGRGRAMHEKHCKGSA